MNKQARSASTSPRDDRQFSFFLRFARLEDPLDLRLIPSDPNFDATIGLIVTTPEDYWSLAPLARGIPESELVIGLPRVTPEEREEAKLLLNLLAKQASADHLRWRMYVPEEVEDYQDESEIARRRYIQRGEYDLLNFFGKYQLLVATSNEPFLLNPYLLAIKKVLFWEKPFWYGSESLNRDLLPRIVSHLDGVVAPSEYLADVFRPFCPALSIGCPRLTARKTATKVRSEHLLYIPSRYNPALLDTVENLWRALPDGRKLVVLLSFYRLLSQYHWMRDKRFSKIEFRFRGEKDASDLISEAGTVLLEDTEALLDCLYFKKEMILRDTSFWALVGYSALPVPPANWKSYGESQAVADDIGVVLRDPGQLGQALRHLRDKKIAARLRRNISQVRPYFLSSDGEPIKKAARFFRAVIRMPRRPESFISRVAEQQRAGVTYADYLQNVFGTLPPQKRWLRRIFQILANLDRS